jgi:hypothetical protein
VTGRYAVGGFAGTVLPEADITDCSFYSFQSVNGLETEINGANPVGERHGVTLKPAVLAARIFKKNNRAVRVKIYREAGTEEIYSVWLAEYDKTGRLTALTNKTAEAIGRTEGYVDCEIKNGKTEMVKVFLWDGGGKMLPQLEPVTAYWYWE